MMQRMTKKKSNWCEWKMFIFAKCLWDWNLNSQQHKTRFHCAPLKATMKWRMFAFGDVIGMFVYIQFNDFSFDFIFATFWFLPFLIRAFFLSFFFGENSFLKFNDLTISLEKRTIFDSKHGNKFLFLSLHLNWHQQQQWQPSLLPSAPTKRAKIENRFSIQSISFNWVSTFSFSFDNFDFEWIDKRVNWCRHKITDFFSQCLWIDYVRRSCGSLFTIVRSMKA